ncbi:XAC0095 family protein [Lysobacter silvisoli]|uniref:Uncharacterized protein n=1 Tax=Lysobacter silvisoli TaxID=2293254 RepID=A0A371K631_9GAMM|nr:hypothetical protein [Lysobacter silvisoli]RDZ29312.1 hypothetical protein DX914_09580 [Lysobacter silvisoli]
MARKTPPTAPRSGVVIPEDAFHQLYRFHQELQGIVRTLQPEVLAQIGYRNTRHHQNLHQIFTAMARQLDPVMDACEWLPAACDQWCLGAGKRLH